MKKIYSLMIAVLLVVAGGCSRGGSKTADSLPDSDTVVSELTEGEAEGIVPTIPLKSNGLPGITIGMAVNKIPSSFEGLYDHVSYEPDSDYGAIYRLMNGNDDSAVVCAGFGKKNVEWIVVYSPAVFAELDNGEMLVPGMSVKKFSEITGVKSFEYNEMTGINVVVGPYNVQPDYEVTPEADRRISKAGDGKGVLTLEDFLPTATIYSIGINHE